SVCGAREERPAAVRSGAPAGCQELEISAGDEKRQTREVPAAVHRSSQSIKDRGTGLELWKALPDRENFPQFETRSLCSVTRSTPILCKLRYALAALLDSGHTWITEHREN